MAWQEAAAAGVFVATFLLLATGSGHNLCPDDRVGTVTWAEHPGATP